jgi:alpha-L-fucosidase
MRRRDFCKVVVAAAAARMLPLRAQKGNVSSSPLFQQLVDYRKDYATFCATPPDKRQFYSLANGDIVRENLDEGSWQPTAWGEPPDLPIPGGSWDGVPMESPIADLAGEGPYRPTWESLLQYEAPEWYRDAKFGISRDTCILAALSRIPLSPQCPGRPPASRILGSMPHPSSAMRSGNSRRL